MTEEFPAIDQSPGEPTPADPASDIRDDDVDSGDAAEAPDLDVIEADLDAVEAALDRLAAGTYWTDEVTGRPIDDAVLEADPTARRAST